MVGLGKGVGLGGMVGLGDGVGETTAGADPEQAVSSVRSRSIGRVRVVTVFSLSVGEKMI
jgi:hypothetical protein